MRNILSILDTPMQLKWWQHFFKPKSAISDYVSDLCMAARVAADAMACTDVAIRNKALETAAQCIDAQRATILASNDLDCATAAHRNYGDVLIDRLRLNDARIDAMIASVRMVAKLDDPIHDIESLHKQASGIVVGSMHVPLGVVAMIYESRPNVSAEASALILKSGNAAILRGGSESMHSNKAIVACMQQGLEEVGLVKTGVQLITNTDRAVVGELLRRKDDIDMLVPRGGKSLTQRVAMEAQMPVLKHLDGICHVYIDREADMKMALEIAVNSKTHRYGVCNAAETVLVHQECAGSFLPDLASEYTKVGVEIRGCQRSCDLLAMAKIADEQDWHTEYLAPIISIKIVNSMTEAINHINHYGSHHTDSIVTADQVRAQRFLRAVDSGSVMHNASTRFADGYEYGLGGEIGISTNKLHARGPVGLRGLTSCKYIVLGEGNIRH